MTNPNEAICRLLGLSTPPAQLSLYSLLGLRAGEPDPAKIRAALQAAAAKLRAAAAAPAAPADAVAAAGKALQRAQATLLSPEAKARYDEALRGISSQPAAHPKAPPEKPPAAKPPAANPPAGRPAAAKPKAGPAPAEPEPEVVTRPPRLEDFLPPGDPHRPFDLQCFLRDEIDSEPHRESVQERKDALETLRTGGAPAAARGGELASTQLSERGIELRQRLRRRRAARNAATVGGLSLVAAGLLAYAVYVFYDRQRGRDRLADRGPILAPAAQREEAQGPTAGGFTDPPVGETAAAGTADASLPELPSVVVAEAAADAATETAADGGPAEAGGGEARMDRTSQLVRIAEESFDAAYAGLEPGAALRLEGGEEVSIVERSAERLVLRRGGKNETHPRTELPPEVLEAVLDAELDRQHPVDVAARGVFLLRYSAGQAYQAAGREHLAAAAAGDPRFGKLDEAMLKPQ